MVSFLAAIKLKPTHELAWTNYLALLDNTGKGIITNVNQEINVEQSVTKHAQVVLDSF